MGVRVILTTGGTGGHIFPALAVAEQLRREGAELLFVGSQYGSEAKLAKQAGLEFRGLPVRGVLGRGLRSVGALWGLFRAVFMARAIVKDFRPDAVIGFGAYASFPSLVAAMSVKDSFITAMMVGSSWGSPTGSGSSSWDTSSLTSSTWAAE